MQRSVQGALITGMLLLLQPFDIAAETPSYQEDINTLVNEVTEDVIAWRRDIHANPELGNRETRTSALVAAHLRTLGFDEVRTGVAHTGVVGILRGGMPGKTIALRADMDALPVTERVDLPFASKVRTMYNGREVGVMHACGHDVHTAVLMGTASVLASMREEIPGTIVFIFQPAEEGSPVGERGGAILMIEEGVLDAPAPEAIFGLHTAPMQRGLLGYRSGGIMASSDGLKITIEGRQTHGAMPWSGVDPIVVAAQVVMGLQTITSRQINPSDAPSVITIATINGGTRGNIIPASVEMTGTIRITNPAVREDLFERIKRTATSIAQSAGASAEVTISPGAAITYNDPALTRQILPSLQRAAPEAAIEIPPLMPSEDFSFYQERIPGVYFFLGIAPPGVENPAPNHSPFFYVDEEALPIGVHAMTAVAMDYLTSD